MQMRCTRRHLEKLNAICFQEPHLSLSDNSTIQRAFTLRWAFSEVLFWHSFTCMLSLQLALICFLFFTCDQSLKFY